MVAVDAVAGVGIGVFGLLWLPWSQFTWSANTVPGNNRIVRVIFLIATAASVPMAAAVTTAFDEGGAVFAIPLGMMVTLWMGSAPGRDLATKVWPDS